MIDVPTILTSLVASLGLNGVGLWLFQEIISSRLKHKYERELEDYKSKLKYESDAEIERLKSSLQTAAAERNVRVTRVFEDTAKTLATIYAKLVALHSAFDAYTQLLEPSTRDELRNQFRDKVSDFVQYFLPNKIYIPKDTAERIREFYSTIYTAGMQFTMALQQEKSQMREPGTEGKLFDKFFKSTDEIPKLLIALEDDFQKILGLMPDTTSTVTAQGKIGSVLTR